MTSQMEVQIGKNGLTNEFIEGIKQRFEKPQTKNIKVTVLRSARDSREDVKDYAEEIVKKLGKKFTYRIIGFSIFLKKWRQERN